MLTVTGRCWCVTGPLKKYGTLQPASDLPALYTDVSGQNQQQFPRLVNSCAVALYHTQLLTVVCLLSVPQL